MWLSRQLVLFRHMFWWNCSCVNQGCEKMYPVVLQLKNTHLIVLLISTFQPLDSCENLSTQSAAPWLHYGLVPPLEETRGRQSVISEEIFKAFQFYWIRWEITERICGENPQKKTLRQTQTGKLWICVINTSSPNHLNILSFVPAVSSKWFSLTDNQTLRRETYCSLACVLWSLQMELMGSCFKWLKSCLSAMWKRCC